MPRVNTASFMFFRIFFYSKGVSNGYLLEIAPEMNLPPHDCHFASRGRAHRAAILRNSSTRSGRHCFYRTGARLKAHRSQLPERYWDPLHTVQYASLSLYPTPTTAVPS